MNLKITCPTNHNKNMEITVPKSDLISIKNYTQTNNYTTNGYRSEWDYLETGEMDLKVGNFITSTLLSYGLGYVTAFIVTTTTGSPPAGVVSFQVAQKIAEYYIENWFIKPYTCFKYDMYENTAQNLYKYEGE